jgi:cell division protein FtsZ
MLEFDDDAQGPGRPVIKVIGVGGGGGNALNTMIEAGVEGVDFIVANTDCQVLEASLAGTKVHLGKTLTKGLGAGANPEIGRAAALEDAQRVAEALTGADMVFVTAGMGGGTGTGAAPVIAQVARDLGALTVGVVTKPFAFEGSQRKKKASSGIAELGKAVDALIVIPNDRLVSLAGMKMTLKDAFAMVDNVCLNAVRGISDLVIAPGLINVDFADVRTIMTGMGRALMGTGYGSGDKRAIEAAQQAISSPLLEDVSINGATGILLNITGGPDLTLAEMNEACSLIAEAADPDANIIFGSVIDAHAGDQVRITVIATGFNAHANEQPAPSAGRGGQARGRDGQMALPMQAGAAIAHTIASPTARGGYAAPVPQARAPEAGGEPINLDDFYMNMEQVPPAALGATPPPPPQQPGSEWTPPERPIIRPQSAAGGNAPMVRRAPAQVPSSPRPADELGVEESEFDKPTYLRRGLFAPE